jgi:uncharacterized cupin superfamily protein
VPLKAFGLDLNVLLTTEATGGAISVLMGWHKPGEGPPDHLHFSQEEVFFILEGTYELTVDGQTSTAGPGTIVFIPHYFKAISDLAAGGGFTGDKVMQINKQFNTEFPHYANSRGTVARRE